MQLCAVKNQVLAIELERISIFIVNPSVNLNFLALIFYSHLFEIFWGNSGYPGEEWNMDIKSLAYYTQFLKVKIDFYQNFYPI